MNLFLGQLECIHFISFIHSCIARHRVRSYLRQAMSWVQGQCRLREQFLIQNLALLLQGCVTPSSSRHLLSLSLLICRMGITTLILKGVADQIRLQINLFQADVLHIWETWKQLGSLTNVKHLGHHAREQFQPWAGGGGKDIYF